VTLTPFPSTLPFRTRIKPSGTFSDAIPLVQVTCRCSGRSPSRSLPPTTLWGDTASPRALTFEARRGPSHRGALYDQSGPNRPMFPHRHTACTATKAGQPRLRTVVSPARTKCAGE